MQRSVAAEHTPATAHQPMPAPRPGRCTGSRPPDGGAQPAGPKPEAPPPEPGASIGERSSMPAASGSPGPSNGAPCRVRPHLVVDRRLPSTTDSSDSQWVPCSGCRSTGRGGAGGLLPQRRGRGGRWRRSRWYWPRRRGWWCTPMGSPRPGDDLPGALRYSGRTAIGLLPKGQPTLTVGRRPPDHRPGPAWPCPAIDPRARQTLRPSVPYIYGAPMTAHAMALTSSNEGAQEPETRNHQEKDVSPVHAVPP
jgi:hypothetical protein